MNGPVKMQQGWLSDLLVLGDAVILIFPLFSHCLWSGNNRSTLICSVLLNAAVHTVYSALPLVPFLYDEDVVFFLEVYLRNLDTQHEAQTRPPEIKICMVFNWAQPGAPKM